MSTTISAVIVQLLTIFLPMLGVEVGSEALTTTVQTIILVSSGLWIWKERVAKGDVNILGGRI